LFDWQRSPLRRVGCLTTAGAALSTAAACELALAVFAAADPPQLTIVAHQERDDK
jgi:hypothetical protein